MVLPDDQNINIEKVMSGVKKREKYGELYVTLKEKKLLEKHTTSCIDSSVAIVRFQKVHNVCFFLPESHSSVSPMRLPLHRPHHL